MNKFIQLAMMLFFICNAAFAQTLTIGRPMVDVTGEDKWLYNPYNYLVVLFPDGEACPANLSWPISPEKNEYFFLSFLEENIGPETLGYDVPLENGRAYAVAGYTRLTSGYLSLTSDCVHITASPGSTHYFAPSFDRVPNTELMRKSIDVLSAPRSGGYYVGFTRGTSCAKLIVGHKRVVKLGVDLRQRHELVGGPHWQYGIYQLRSDGRFAQVGETCKPIDVRWFTGYVEITPMPPPGKFWMITTGRVMAGFDFPSSGRVGVSILAEPLFIGSQHLGIAVVTHFGFNAEVAPSNRIKPSLAAGVAIGGTLELTPKTRFSWRVGVLAGLGGFSTRCAGGQSEVWRCNGYGLPITMLGPQWSQLVSANFTWPTKSGLRIGVGFATVNQVFVANTGRSYLVRLYDNGSFTEQPILFGARWHSEVHVSPTMVLEW